MLDELHQQIIFRDKTGKTELLQSQSHHLCTENISTENVEGSQTEETDMCTPDTKALRNV